MGASKVSAVLLSGMYYCTNFVGLAFLRSKKGKEGVLEIEDVLCTRRFWWKWIFVLCRILPLCMYIKNYVVRSFGRTDWTHLIIPFLHLMIAIFSYLWILRFQLVNGKRVTKVVNRLLRLFWQVRSQARRKIVDFGGTRELVLILRIILPIALEFCAFIAIFDINFAYVFLISHIVVRISIIWYIAVGVLYSEVIDCIRFEIKKLQHPHGNLSLIRQRKNHRRLLEALNLFREISAITDSFQEIFNLNLFVSLINFFCDVVILSHSMIARINFYDFWTWFFIVKTIHDLLLLSSCVEGAVNQGKRIREINWEIIPFGEHKDMQRTVEEFIISLNLLELRVNLLGLCDVSMKLFLFIFAALLSWVIYVLQCVLQLRG